jgi:alpha/beta hydrolase fold
MEPLEILRTPDDRFDALPDFPYLPRYIELRDLRIHYVEAGPPDADPVVLMHGEPSWSFLYRKLIPIIAGAGYRVVAPDLVGFGRSDKPVERGAYTYRRHVDWMWAALDGLGLERWAYRTAAGCRAFRALRASGSSQYRPAYWRPATWSSLPCLASVVTAWRNT